jgi:hypothetical protein
MPVSFLFYFDGVCKIIPKDRLPLFVDLVARRSKLNKEIIWGKLSISSKEDPFILTDGGRMLYIWREEI